MKKLILAAAAASGLAIAVPLLAAHDDHGAHESDAHVRDTAMFMKMHGEQVSAAINHPTRKEDMARPRVAHCLSP
jgi:hypothetical protein